MSLPIKRGRRYFSNLVLPDHEMSKGLRHDYKEWEKNVQRKEECCQATRQELHALEAQREDTPEFAERLERALGNHFDALSESFFAYDTLATNTDAKHRNAYKYGGKANANARDHLKNRHVASLEHISQIQKEKEIVERYKLEVHHMRYMQVHSYISAFCFDRAKGLLENFREEEQKELKEHIGSAQKELYSLGCDLTLLVLEKKQYMHRSVRSILKMIFGPAKAFWMPKITSFCPPSLSTKQRFICAFRM